MPPASELFQVIENRCYVAEIFCFVSGAHMIGWRCAPVIGPLSQPFEGRMGRETLQRFVGISADIGGKTKPGTGFHDAGHRIQEVRLDDAAFMMLLFRPGIGKQDEDPVEARIGQGGDKVTRVLIPYPEIGKPLGLYVRQAFGDAFHEDLTGHKPDVRCQFSLRARMFAAAKTDLQPDRPVWAVKQGLGVQRAIVWQADSQFGQQIINQTLLSGREGATARPAIGANRCVMGR